MFLAVGEESKPFSRRPCGSSSDIHLLQSATVDNLAVDCHRAGFVSRSLKWVDQGVNNSLANFLCFKGDG